MVNIPVVNSCIKMITQLEISVFDGMKEIKGKYLTWYRSPTAHYETCTLELWGVWL